MPKIRKFDRYLEAGEQVSEIVQALSVNGEFGYMSAVTNKRIIFLKGRTMHQILEGEISSTSRESERARGVGVLILGIIIFLAGLVGRGLGTVATLGLILGLLIILLYAWSKKEFLTLYTGGREFRLEGTKVDLERLMFSVRQQLMGN